MRALAILVWFGIAAGCGHAPSRPASLDRPDLRYTLTLIRSPSVAVRITLVTPGSPDGATRFVLGPGWGASDEPERDLRDFAVIDDAGARLPSSGVAGNDQGVSGSK